MYNIVFYENERGESDVYNFIMALKAAADISKDARINYNKVIAYIDALEEYGSRVGYPVVRHLDGEIWELRPLSNRILYAYQQDRTYVLLHHFVKNTRKTPAAEIEQAKREIDEYRRRVAEDENLEGC